MPRVSARSLPREIAARIATRTLAFALALTLLVFALQLVRALERLPAAILREALLPLIQGALPALVTLTAPMALLVATGLTLGERAQDGELRGWATLGRADGELLRGPLLLGLALALGVALLAGWLAPSALRSASRAVEDATVRAVVAELDTGRALVLEGGHRIEAGAARVVEPQGLVLEALRWHDTHGGRALEADRVTLDAAALRLDGLRLEGVGDEGVVLQIEAGRVETRSPLADARLAAQDLVPPVETLSVDALYAQARAGEQLARGQLAKRAILVLLPLGLTLLLAAAVIRGGDVLGRPGAAMLAALGMAVVLHSAARGSELAMRASVVAGVGLVVLLPTVTLLGAWLWLRRD